VIEFDYEATANAHGLPWLVLSVNVRLNGDMSQHQAAAEFAGTPPMFLHGELARRLSNPRDAEDRRDAWD
jgi:hypothetical protein